MTRFVRLALASALVLTTATAAIADEGIVVKRSAHSVQATLDKLESVVSDKGFGIVARVDHAAAAAKAGEQLRPTQVLIFGNPKVGTALMKSNQRIGLDLPIRVVAWEDEAGAVWVAYHAPKALVGGHDIGDRAEVVQRMTGALGKFTDAATK